MIPAALSEVDTDFLTRLMQSTFPGVCVTTAKIMGEVHGTATKARLKLSYADGPQGPSTLFLKAGWEKDSEILRQVGIFSREPRAYAELLPDLGVPAPACYGAVWDEAALQGVLLLEDLDAAGAQIRNPESRVGPDEVHQLLLGLARMHGTTAKRTDLLKSHWIRRLFEDYERPGSYLCHILQDRELEAFLALPRGEHIPEALRNPEAIRRTFGATIAFAREDRAHLLLHGDAHVGNSYVDAGGRPALLDWQCVSAGGWAYDVAYYLASALDADARRLHEESLLDAYAQCLAASGGPDLGRDAAMAHYRAYLCYGFLVWLANSTSFQPEAYNAIVAARFGQAMVDHGLI